MKYVDEFRDAELGRALSAEILSLCEDAAGGHHTVELALVDAGAGDEVLVHAGVALVTL